MGTWCFMTRQSPDVFLSLTRLQREQFEKAAVAARKKGWI